MGMGSKALEIAHRYIKMGQQRDVEIWLEAALRAATGKALDGYETRIDFLNTPDSYRMQLHIDIRPTMRVTFTNNSSMDVISPNYHTLRAALDETFPDKALIGKIAVLLG